MLKPRQLIPPLALHTPDGRTVRAWDFKQKKNLVIAFLHSDCAACRDFLARLATHPKELAECEAVALVAFLEAPPPALTDALPPEIITGADFSGRSARAFLEKDAVSGTGSAAIGVFVTDRYGELFARWTAGADHRLPGIAEILSWLEQIELACEECGAPHWPVDS